MSGDEILAEARKLEKNLLNFFWRQGVSYTEGEDLLQETYLRLWNYRDQYRETSAKFSTFVFTVARQVRIDALRRVTRRERREQEWYAERPATQQAERMEREDVLWAVSRLSEPLREVVELGVFQDLPYAQISEILGIPVGTVKSRMSNALKKLKEEFER